MEFFNSAVDVLQTLVIALGAGLGIWGVINLLEGYGNDNPGAKSQGMKQLMAGGGVALIGMPVSYTHLDVYKRQTLYIAARGIYTNAGGLTTRDLADAEVVDAAALRMIVNALLIARYGCAVLDIHERGSKA